MKIGELTINCNNTSIIKRLTISPLTYILMDYLFLVHIKTLSTIVTIWKWTDMKWTKPYTYLYSFVYAKTPSSLISRQSIDAFGLNCITSWNTETFKHLLLVHDRSLP